MYLGRRSLCTCRGVPPGLCPPATRLPNLLQQHSDASYSAQYKCTPGACTATCSPPSHPNHAGSNLLCYIRLLPWSLYPPPSAVYRLPVDRGPGHAGVLSRNSLNSSLSLLSSQSVPVLFEPNLHPRNRLACTFHHHATNPLSLSPSCLSIVFRTTTPPPASYVPHLSPVLILCPGRFDPQRPLPSLCLFSLGRPSHFPILSCLGTCNRAAVDQPTRRQSTCL